MSKRSLGGFGLGAFGMLLLLAVAFFFYSVEALGQNNELQVAEGRAQYEMVSRESSRPKYGTCWTRALKDLETGCKNLDDEVQSRLALNFANCFLAKAGQNTFPCQSDTPIEACLQEVDNNAFTAYSNFFTHTQNMCYFLQSQVWQEDTEATITSLASNSAKVSESLAESHQLQQQLVWRQEESLEYHKELANGIVGAKSNVREMLEEFKVSTVEQKTLIFEVFDRVARLQNLVVSEVSWLYTVIFYSACLLVIYLVTATKRTADARLWLFVILTVNFAVERLVVKWTLPHNGGEAEVMNLSQLVNDRIWMARQTAIAFSIIVLAIIAYKFKDYNKINNHLLEEIRRQNMELKRNMESFQVDGRLRMSSQDSVDFGGTNTTSLSSLSTHLNQLLAEDTGFVGDEEDFDEDDEDEEDSLNASGRSDVSYRPSRDVSYSDDEDFGTAHGSRETTPVNHEVDTAMEALSSCLVTSTSFLSNSLSSTPLKASPYGTSVKPLEQGTPIKHQSYQAKKQMVTPPSEGPRYNLRRTPGRSSNSSATSSILQQESPEAFARVVKKQLQVTKRNSAKLSLALRKKNEQAEFSSDER